MLKETIMAAAATALLGSVGTSFAGEMEKSTAYNTDGSRTVTKVVTHPAHPVVVKKIKKVKVVHHPVATSTKVVHRATVVKTPTSKTVIVHPSKTLVAPDR